MNAKLLASSLVLSVVPLLQAQDGPQPKQLTFSISKGTSPGSKATYSGNVVFSRKDAGHCFQVKWKLSDGSSQTGFGVAYPASGVIAVGYGPDLTGIAIYKKDGDKVDARFALAEKDGEIDSYQLTRGDKPGLLKVKGGGTVTLNQGEEETGTADFKLASGSFSGPVVGQGDFLALAAGGKRVGVGIYKQSGNGAEGRWTVLGATGAGTEDLIITEVDGEKVDVGSPESADSGGGGGGEEAEVEAIAKAVRGNKAELLKLKPTRAQLADIAVSAEATRKLEAYVKGLFADLPEDGLQADDDETKIVVFSGADLPGGYSQHAEKLNKDVKIYGFKYLNPNKDAGTSFDGLVKVRGKWIMVPKMWRAFKD